MGENDQLKEQIEAKRPMAYICGGIFLMALVFENVGFLLDCAFHFELQNATTKMNSKPRTRFVAENVVTVSLQIHDTEN